MPLTASAAGGREGCDRSDGEQSSASPHGILQLGQQQYYYRFLIDQIGPLMLVFCLPCKAAPHLSNPELGCDFNTDPMGRSSYAKSPLLLFWNLLLLHPGQQSSLGERRGTHGTAAGTMWMRKHELWLLFVPTESQQGREII